MVEIKDKNFCGPQQVEPQYYQPLDPALSQDVCPFSSDPEPAKGNSVDETSSYKDSKPLAKSRRLLAKSIKDNSHNAGAGKLFSAAQKDAARAIVLDPKKEMQKIKENVAFRLEKAHLLTPEAKKRIIEGVILSGHRYYELANLDFGSAELQVKARNVFNSLASAVFETAMNFAKSDPSPEIKKMAVLCEGYKHLADGDPEKAYQSLYKARHLSPHAMEIVKQQERNRVRGWSINALNIMREFAREARQTRLEEVSSLNGGTFIRAMTELVGIRTNIHEKVRQVAYEMERFISDIEKRINTGEDLTISSAKYQILREDPNKYPYLSKYTSLLSLSPGPRVINGAVLNVKNPFGVDFPEAGTLWEKLEASSLPSRLVKKGPIEKDLIGYAYYLETRKGMGNTAQAIYQFVGMSTKDPKIKAEAEHKLKIQSGGGSTSDIALKFLHSISPEDVTEQIGLMLVSAGVGTAVKLATLAKLAAWGVKGYKAVLAAVTAGTLVEASTFWTGSGGKEIMGKFMDENASKLITPEYVLKSYCASLSTISGMKMFGAIGKTVAPNLARALKMITQEGKLTAGGRLLAQTIGHTFGFGGLLSTGQANQFLGLQSAPKGGFKESFINDLLFYIEFEVAGLGARGLSGSKYLAKSRQSQEAFEHLKAAQKTRSAATPKEPLGVRAKIKSARSAISKMVPTRVKKALLRLAYSEHGSVKIPFTGNDPRVDIVDIAYLKDTIKELKQKEQKERCIFKLEDGLDPQKAIKNLPNETYEKDVIILDQQGRNIYEQPAGKDASHATITMRVDTIARSNDLAPAIANAVKNNSVLIIKNGKGDPLEVYPKNNTINVFIGPNNGDLAVRALKDVLNVNRNDGQKWSLTIRTPPSMINGKALPASPAIGELGRVIAGHLCGNGKGKISKVIEETRTEKINAQGEVTEKEADGKIIYKPDHGKKIQFQPENGTQMTNLSKRVMIERNAMVLSEKLGISINIARNFFVNAMRYASINEHIPNSTKERIYFDYLNSSDWYKTWDMGMKNITEDISNGKGTNIKEILNIINTQSGSKEAHQLNCIEFFRILARYDQRQRKEAYGEIMDIFRRSGGAEVQGAGLAIVRGMYSEKFIKKGSSTNEARWLKRFKQGLATGKVVSIPLTTKGSGKTPDLAIISNGEVIYVELKNSHLGNHQDLGEMTRKGLDQLSNRAKDVKDRFERNRRVADEFLVLNVANHRDYNDKAGAIEAVKAAFKSAAGESVEKQRIKVIIAFPSTSENYQLIYDKKTGNVTGERINQPENTILHHFNIRRAPQPSVTVTGAGQPNTQ